MSIKGSELQVGDTIKVWWKKKKATVAGFRSHDSEKDGWFVVDFADGVSMTVEPMARFEKGEA